MAEEGVKFPSARQGVWMRDQSGVPVFTRPWFLFLQALWTRQGGASAPDTTDLVQRFGQEPQAQDQMAAAVERLQGEVAEQREQIAELHKEIQAIRQGTLI